MPRVFLGEAFAFEDMPQMGPAGGADDFRPVAVRIGGGGARSRARRRQRTASRIRESNLSPER